MTWLAKARFSFLFLPILIEAAVEGLVKALAGGSTCSYTDISSLVPAAEAFIPKFYNAINDLQPLGAFYTSSCEKYTTPPSITINGHVLEDVSKFEFCLKTQSNGLTNRVVHEVQSLDAQVLNPKYINGAPDWVVQQVASTTGPSGPAKDRVDALSIMVQVTGLVKYGHSTDREAPPPRNFSEHIVLVPNWNAVGKNAQRGGRRWLIQSEIFRAL
ncbi:hypothetical protein MKZ38_008970 [Zalerion maritima]|uniref:NTF2 domain-containing protein n=1 Tax=Zalerion maritima TaxID=339359 RepID=A0AAD5WT71_9PEZI|nr:hypothetical protein MKZ38_008970 [Zalerion maritima]